MGNNGQVKTPLLEIKDLHVQVEGKEIVKGLNLTVQAGEIHALMGRNGSGKSTLANTLMGHPKYEVTAGQALLLGQDLIGMTVDKRAQLGLFLAFQYPLEIPGVSMANFLRLATKSMKGAAFSSSEFRKSLKEKMSLLSIDESFATRYVNEGFSGGEKKRAEILQMALLQPKMAVLDEPDSGLDIDALKTVAEGVNAQLRPELGILLITHYQRLLDYIQPHFVHVMVDGRIVRSGGKELAKELESTGYEAFVEESKEGVR